MRRSPWFVPLFVACAVGCNPCNQQQAAAPRGAAHSEPKAKAPPPPVPAEPAPPPPPQPLAEQSALQALLGTWLDAQNKGDFASYGRLYASKFQGVKRVGNKVSRMDREEWLKDRERMFQKPMTVSAPDPELDIRARAATITFTQTWESGTFKDEGPKRLLVVKEGEDLRIAQEELLGSTVLRSQKKLDALAGFAFVVDLGGPWAMIGAVDGAVKEHGPLERIEIPDGFAVKAGLSGEPPAEIAAYEGKAVQVTTTTGMQCGAKLSGPEYVVQVVPHFGEVSMWRDAAASGQQIDVTSEIWNMAWHKNLALHVTIDDLARCGGAPLFLRDASAPLPLTASKLEQAPREEDVVKALRQLKSYAARQTAFEHEQAAPPAPGTEPPPRWDERAAKRLDAFRFPDTSETIVALRLNPERSCGDESPQAWAVFTVPDDEKKPPRMIKDLDDDVPGEILLVLDIERDGKLEYIVRDQLGASLYLVSSDHEPLVTWSLDYQDCPC